MNIQASLEQRLLARSTAAIVLAGGKGSRLGLLTRDECKPALPFGGYCRNIDFSLSNCVNSGINRIGVATQYKDSSLIRHIDRVWTEPGSPRAGLIEPWRQQDRSEDGGYCGTADAVYQNWCRIEATNPQLVLILAGDHIYKMDYRLMLSQHTERGADVTVGCVEVPIEEAPGFGVMSIDKHNRIIRFAEKPRHPESLPGQPGRALGSMGIYVFNRSLLGRVLRADAQRENSSHDFGCDLIPRLIQQAKVYAYPFTREAVVGGGHWRDVGTIPAYWRAHMELLDGIPGFRLDDASWPIRSEAAGESAAREHQGFGDQRFEGHRANITDSVVVGACSVDRATVHHSVLYLNASVARHSAISNAVIFPNAVIGRNCQLENVIVAAGVRVPDGTRITSTFNASAAIEPALVTNDSFNPASVVRPYGLVRCRRHHIGTQIEIGVNL